MKAPETTLEMVQRHIRQGEAMIARQEALTAKLERDGHETLLVDAQKMLVSMHDLQRQHCAHRDRELAKQVAKDRT
jgi:hypothetical protein